MTERAGEKPRPPSLDRVTTTSVVPVPEALCAIQPTWRASPAAARTGWLALPQNAGRASSETRAAAENVAPPSPERAASTCQRLWYEQPASGSPISSAHTSISPPRESYASCAPSERPALRDTSRGGEN